MTLDIAKLVTCAQIPRRLGVKPQLVEYVARERLGVAVARQLAPSWMGRTHVVRIRGLAVRLRLAPGRFLDEEAFAEDWARAFTRTLSTALANHTGEQRDMVIAGTRADWLAAFICDLLSGTAHSHWEYEEFRPLFGLGLGEAVSKLLGDEPAEIAAVFFALERRNVLDRVLGLCEEAALEQLSIAVERALGAAEANLSIEELLMVGRQLLAQQWPLSTGDLQQRRVSLRLFLTLGDPSAKMPPWSPRRVLHALTALAILVDLAPSENLAVWEDALAERAIARCCTKPPPPVVPTLLAHIRRIIQQYSRANVRPQRTEPVAQLSHLVAELRASAFSSVRDKSTQTNWVDSDCAGLFALVGLLQQLRWSEKLMSSPLAVAQGPRLLTYVLVGLGQSVLNRFETASARMDPGVALFAGWIAEPNWAGFRNFLATATPSSRTEILNALHPEFQLENDTAASWSATFDYLAGHLIREFASRIRGFRQASRAFIVKQFLSLGGRIYVEEKRLLVVLHSSPYAVALHMAGLDSPIESVSWLGGRRLEFQLKGL